MKQNVYCIWKSDGGKKSSIVKIQNISTLQEVVNGFGYYGVLSADPDTECVQCHICGKWYKCVGNHIRVHGVTEEDYKEEFELGVIGLCSPESPTGSLKRRVMPSPYFNQCPECLSQNQEIDDGPDGLRCLNCGHEGTDIRQSRYFATWGNHYTNGCPNGFSAIVYDREGWRRVFRAGPIYSKDGAIRVACAEAERLFEANLQAADHADELAVAAEMSRGC